MSFIWEWFVCQIIYRISIEFSPDDVGYIIAGYMLEIKIRKSKMDLNIISLNIGRRNNH